MDVNLKKKNTGLIAGIAVAVVIIAIILVMVFSGSSKDPLQEQLDLGQKYMQEGNYEEALAAYLAAIDIDDKCVEAYIGAAKAYEALGEIDAAIDILALGLEKTGDPQLEELMIQIVENASNLPEDDSEQSENISNSEEEFAVEAPTDFAGQVLCDTDTYAISLDKVYVDENFYLTITYTNKSSEAMQFDMKAPAINGLMYKESLDGAYLEAGESKTVEEYISDSWLEKYDMRRITEIFYTIEIVAVTNDEGWTEYEYVTTEYPVVYPFGESEVAYYVFEPTEKDILVVDNAEYKIYVNMDVSSFSADFVMYAENHTSDKAQIRSSDVLANDRAINKYNLVGSYIAPGKAGFSDGTLFDDDIEEAGIRSFDDLIKVSLICDVTEHYEGLNTSGYGVSETVAEEKVDLYLPGKEGQEVALPEIEADKILLDNEYCTIYQESAWLGEELTLKYGIINKTDHEIEIEINNQSMGDKVAKGGYESITIPAGASSFLESRWDPTELENAGVPMYEEAGFDYKADVIGRDTATGNELFRGSLNGHLCYYK